MILVMVILMTRMTMKKILIHCSVYERSIMMIIIMNITTMMMMIMKMMIPLQAVPNGYPIPDPNPKFFSIPDPYPISFQNHRVFRVSGISENYVFDMENGIKEGQDID